MNDDPVFLSYPTQSTMQVKLLRDYLHKKRIRSIWIDQTAIGVGQTISGRIKEGVQSSRCCVFVLNQHSLQSYWCMAEVGAFWGANKPIFIYRTEPKCDVPDFLADLRHTDNPDEIVEACKRTPPLEKENTTPQHPTLALFERCGLTKVFRIRTMDHEREVRIKQLVEEECGREKPAFRLLASTGFNYLHPTGKVWLSGLGDAITKANAQISAVLASPFSQFAITRALANDVSHQQWEWRGMPPQLADLVERKNVELRVTGFPVNCSLFFTSKAVFYDPYLWGRPNNATPTENNFWVFEFQNKNDPGYDCYQLLEKHFEFLLKESVPMKEILGERLARYRELARRFEEKMKEIRDRGHYDFAVSI